MSRTTLAPKETLLEVEAPDVAVKARVGQFAIVIAREGGERVPLTICNIDPAKGTVSFAFHEVGKTTKELGTFQEGENLMNVTGPLGNPSEVKDFGRVLVAGGSIMIAPAILQAKEMKAAGNEVTLVLGCRSKEFLFMREEAAAACDHLLVSSDDGSIGEKGLEFLAELLSKQKFDRCVVLGPVVMMKRVSELTKPYGIPTVVTVTPIMIDGMGMCGVCRVTVGGHTKFGCMDGPEFDGHQVDFEELVKRQRTMLPEERLSSMLWEKNRGCEHARNEG